MRADITSPIEFEIVVKSQLEIGDVNFEIEFHRDAGQLQLA